MDELREGYKNIKGFGLIPNHWDVLDLGNIMNFKNGLNYGKNDVGEEIKILGVGDFQKNFYLNTSDLNKIKYSNLDENYLLENGDLIFVRSNGNKELIGRVLYCENIKERVTYSGFTIRGRLDSNNFIDKYCAYYCSSSLVKKQYMTNGGGTNINNLSQEILSNVKITKPPIKEQENIVTIISTFDKLIDLKEKLLQEKKIIKRGLIQRLLGGTYRFSRYKDKWEDIYIGDFIVENKEKTVYKNQYKVLTSSKRGMYLQNEYFSKQVASKNNIGYRVIKRGQFTYRSMSDSGEFTFNRQNIIDIGCVSPAYSVFSVKKDIDSNFLYYMLNSDNFARLIKMNIQGGTRLAFRFSELKKIRVSLPKLEEQCAISNVLTTVDKEISLLEEKLEILKEQKKGIMQNLLTGRVRVKV